MPGGGDEADTFRAGLPDPVIAMTATPRARRGLPGRGPSLRAKRGNPDPSLQAQRGNPGPPLRAQRGNPRPSLRAQRGNPDPSLQAQRPHPAPVDCRVACAPRNDKTGAHQSCHRDDGHANSKARAARSQPVIASAARQSQPVIASAARQSRPAPTSAAQQSSPVTAIAASPSSARRLPPRMRSSPCQLPRGHDKTDLGRLYRVHPRPAA